MNTVDASDAWEHGPPEAQVAVALLTGFLGSGKTTLLNRLLKHPDTRNVAVVVNEFGAIPIDHHLIETSTDRIAVVGNGCVCCSTRGDLIDCLLDLFRRRQAGDIPVFNRLVIETSGLADPAPILKMLITDRIVARHYRLDGVVTTIDAIHGAETLERHPESIAQTALADRIVLTKTDLADRRTTVALESQLRTINRTAPIHSRNEFGPELFFGTGLYDAPTRSAAVDRWLAANAHHDGALDHRHTHGIRSFALMDEIPWPLGRLEGWLRALLTDHGRDILRIKGLIHVEGMGRPAVIHGVQHVLHSPIVLARWPSSDTTTRLVFITRGIGRDTVVEHLNAFRDAERHERAA